MKAPNPLRIALTGGIASGKSTVAALFARQGVPVIDLDEIAREVVAPGSALLAQVIDRFGAGVCNRDGSLDRRAMRAIIFKDSGARRELEALLHPAIRALAAERSAAAGGAYQIIVIPLLTESGTAGDYDRVLVVDCDAALQRARLAARDGASGELASAALAAQASRAERLSLADDVIRNDGEATALVPQVLELHQHYLRRAAEGAHAPSA